MAGRFRVALFRGAADMQEKAMLPGWMHEKGRTNVRPGTVSEKIGELVTDLFRGLFHHVLGDFAGHQRFHVVVHALAQLS